MTDTCHWWHISGWTPPTLISTCLLPAEALPTGSGAGNLRRKWTRLNQMDREKRESRQKSVSVDSWCLPPRMNGIRRKWEEDVWQLLATLAKRPTCATSVFSLCWSGKLSMKNKVHFLAFCRTLPHCLMSYDVPSFHRTASVRAWFPPYCTALPNCCLITAHSCTVHIFSWTLTYLHFGWCSAPMAGPDIHSSRWSSDNAPVEWQECSVNTQSADKWLCLQTVRPWIL